MSNVEYGLLKNRVFPVHNISLVLVVYFMLFSSFLSHPPMCSVNGDGGAFSLRVSMFSFLPSQNRALGYDLSRPWGPAQPRRGTCCRPGSGRPRSSQPGAGASSGPSTGAHLVPECC